VFFEDTELCELEHSHLSPTALGIAEEALMNTMRIVAIAVVIVGSALAIQIFAQQSGVKRTDLQRHDLSVAGREVVQVRVDIEPGVVAPRHNHPGEEIVYVLEGTLEYRLDGQAPATLKAGDVLFIPNGVIHEVKNVGTAKASELATYIVETGKPLVVLAK
jgi:quercetin dioxygenase-like cupin family protein